MAGGGPGLLKVSQDQMRLRHFSLSMEKAYLGWIRRYVHFINRRHPRDVGVAELEAFLRRL